MKAQALLAISLLMASLLALAAPIHATNDGALDPSFGANGELLVTLADDEIVLANAIRLSPTGDLTLAGAHAAPSATNADMWVCTIPMDGPSASCSARAVVTGDPRVNNALAISYQLDGRRVLGGYAGTSGADDLAFLGVVADSGNALDTSFSGDGRKTIAFAGASEVRAIDARRNTDLLFTGNYYHEAGSPGTGYDCIIGRMSADGTLDSSFAGNGLLSVGWDLGSEASDTCIGQTLFHDGTLAAAAQVVRADGTCSFGIVRTTSDGNLDSSFSGNGLVLVSFDLAGGGSDLPYAITHDRLGRILVAGIATSGGGTLGAVARLLPNGSLDPSFGIGGKLTFSVGGINPDVDAVSSIVVLPPPSNDIAVGGEYDEGGAHQHGFVALFHDNGSFDTSFSGNGRRSLELGASHNNGITGLAVQGGKLVAASSYLYDRSSLLRSPPDFAVFRLYRNQIYGDDFEGGHLFLWSSHADP
jgi:uncharacterized delta-60 repeat protein